MLNVARLLQKHLDINLSGRDGLTVRIIERPGFALSPEQRENLVRDLKTVAASSVRNGTLDY